MRRLLLSLLTLHAALSSAPNLAAQQYRVDAFRFDGRCFRIQLSNPSSTASTGQFVVLWGNVGRGYALESTYEMSARRRQDIAGCYEDSRALVPNPSYPRYTSILAALDPATRRVYIIIDGRLVRNARLQ